MKTKLFLSLFFITFYSCQEEEAPPLSFEVSVRTHGENDVIIDWDNPGEGNMVRFTIDTIESFTRPFISEEVPLHNGSISFSELAPLTRYFLKTELMQDAEVLQTGTEDFTSGYTKHAVAIRYHG